MFKWQDTVIKIIDKNTRKKRRKENVRYVIIFNRSTMRDGVLKSLVSWLSNALFSGSFTSKMIEGYL